MHNTTAMIVERMPQLFVIWIFSWVPNVGKALPAQFIVKVCRTSLFICKKARGFQRFMLSSSETTISRLNFDFLDRNAIQSFFAIVRVFFVDDNMHFQIPHHFLHKKSFKMQTLPMNRVDLQ